MNRDENHFPGRILTPCLRYLALLAAGVALTSCGPPAPKNPFDSRLFCRNLGNELGRSDAYLKGEAELLSNGLPQLLRQLLRRVLGAPGFQEGRA